VTKTCLQCGAVLPSSTRACDFCNSSFYTEDARPERYLEIPAAGLAGEKCFEAAAAPDPDAAAGVLCAETQAAADWRGELAERLEAYRLRKRRPRKDAQQSHLVFEEVQPRAASRAVVAEPSQTPDEAFSFTLAIGPQASHSEKHDSRLEIDVSVPDGVQHEQSAGSSMELNERYGLYPVASLEERRIAALIDAVCLLFAYGGFMALFGSLGGQFTLSKLNAAVYAMTVAIVYLQYFALFTIFGGTTPGMMLRGLQVVSFTGDPPSPRQMLLRSAGYMLSAGALFLGFLWAWWDEDALAWHDRFSRTYLSAQQTDADFESSAVAHGHIR
jgi:uncharacterized RDD family membrane protein YckC